MNTTLKGLDKMILNEMDMWCFGGCSPDGYSLSELKIWTDFDEDRINDICDGIADWLESTRDMPRGRTGYSSKDNVLETILKPELRKHINLRGLAAAMTDRGCDEVISILFE